MSFLGFIDVLFGDECPYSRTGWHDYTWKYLSRHYSCRHCAAIRA